MLRLTAIGLLLSLPAQGATPFNTGADFSFKKNPNGVWQYGYSETHSLDPAAFRLDTYADPSGPVGFWHPAVSSGPRPGWYPYIAYNITNQTQYGSSKGWAVRQGQLAMEASNSGQYSLVRFKAEKAGTYKISARFEGIHFGLSSTDVHVMHNGTSLFDAEIAGYGGDPALHKVEGANPAASYAGTVKLEAGDLVAFAVGYGENKTNYGDTTGLAASIELLAGKQ